MLPPRQLELSLVERLQRPLKTDRRDLEGLTARGVLRDEVARSVSPLGLAAPGAQAIFVLLREVALEIGVGRGVAAKPGEELAPVADVAGTPLGESFARAFRRHQAASTRTSGYARFGESALATIDEPTQVYTSQVWGRAHGHDVRRSLDFSDLAAVFGQVLLGVRETLLRSLGKQRDDAVLLRDPDLIFEGATQVPGTDQGLDQSSVRSAGPTRYEALTDFVAALATLAQTKTASLAEVTRFIAEADADESYREIWDRWSETCGLPEALTYDVAIAVLPLIRQDTDAS